MAQAPPPPTGRSSRWRGAWTLVGVLLLIPIVAPLLIGTYARSEPEVLGFPFFYWYQFLWIPIAAGLTFVCYRLVTREEEREREEDWPR
ncbi:MAG: DUF3311 domain-containing protein [Actinomycetota bacterium]|nr:DUF3311 domain-containing protein [Actinomycetota bacterium]